MNKIQKMMLVGVAVIGLGASAASVMAQQGPGSGPGMMAHSGHAQQTPEQRQERMKAHFAKRSAELRDKLKLTASQEPAWNNFLAATQQGARMQRPDRAQWATLSAPERMEKQLAMMKTHEARMSQRLDATRTFYAALSPEQQKVFNDSTARQHRGHGKRHGHGGHQQGMQQGHQHGHDQQPGQSPAKS
ncbi:Spy/CpxP family protein refolding chaperone [Lacisediminimonas sp.]|uniref:Spy/CpxP family protein refolding chaperone n=1 Tax=Lacisediminimonas sp. TaxID=3060582 RepID=UPI00272716D3|nr:Spy/CpxP family protein refolding chaperone [Lacisediminimonas sp.]MDO8299526.1 Spy/CpxP family protein refolding chaperone [Lacisediminimonas sp.]